MKTLFIHNNEIIHNSNTYTIYTMGSRITIDCNKYKVSNVFISNNVRYIGLI